MRVADVTEKEKKDYITTTPPLVLNSPSLARSIAQRVDAQHSFPSDLVPPGIGSAGGQEVPNQMNVGFVALVYYRFRFR